MKQVGEKGCFRTTQTIKATVGNSNVGPVLDLL
jgi:hypothetical protein